jgi:hypothetical protein
MLMVKPGMAYLDIVKQIKDEFPEYPLFIYQVCLFLPLLMLNWFFLPLDKESLYFPFSLPYKDILVAYVGGQSKISLCGKEQGYVHKFLLVPAISQYLQLRHKRKALSSRNKETLFVVATTKPREKLRYYAHALKCL